MEDLLVNLLQGLVKGAKDLINNFLLSTMDTAFFAEKTMQSYMGGTSTIDFNSIYNVVYTFGIAFLILKFLKKGIDTYILWKNGDATNSVVSLLVKFCEAIIITIGFPYIYKLGIEIATDFGNQVLNAIQMDTSPDALITTLVNIIGTGGLFAGICIVVLIVLVALVYIQLLTRGIEILVLRLGLPIASVGLLDSDGGVFSAYVKKFFQNVITVVVQIILIKFTLILLIGGNYLFAIACSLLALSPKFLQEFALVSQGGGVSRGIQTISSIKRLIK